MEDKLLDHPAFHPIWQACVETDLPACFHGGTARPPYGMGTFEMGNNLFIQHSATNPFEVMRGIASLVGGGVLDLFPEAARGVPRGGRRMAAVLDGAPRRALRADARVCAVPASQAVGGDSLARIFSSHAIPTRRRCRTWSKLSAPITFCMRRTIRTSTADFPHTVSSPRAARNSRASVPKKILHENPTRLYTRLK